MVIRDHCGLIRIIVASTLLAGVSNIVLDLGFWNLRLRCWSYLGLPLSSPVFPCPPAMFLSTTWSGTLQKMTGVTLVTLKCVQYEVLNYRIHLKMIHRVHADHMQPAESGSYNLEGVLCALAVPFLSAWIVIITRQVLMSFRYSASNFSLPLPHLWNFQAKHVHYSILVFWWEAM